MRHPRAFVFSGLLALAAIATSAGSTRSLAHAEGDEAAPPSEDRFLSDVRQLTFEGRRSGEGYFDAAGTRLVFQSEREEGNPFYQIYLLDLETGDIDRVSPGIGKTTCSWLHPNAGKVLFASTHEDPEARAKQEHEIEERASGRERRYSWDYDPWFDLFEKDLATGEMRNLTHARGYDAEGSWSPDGQWIAFSSNRAAYAGDLSEEDKKRLEIDPAYFLDLYIMRADGSGVRQLTNAPGYDGGPFFSPDGERICWRRFSPDGATAEIFTMKIDGTDERQLTKLGAMSWAPYFHPSGKYLIFTTNIHGFANFELYLVDTKGEREPVRVTSTDGFDGLPVFHPDGDQLAWTSNRTPSKQSQIFLGHWNHAAALEALAASPPARTREARRTTPDATARTDPAKATQPAITAADLEAHVRRLASDEMEGRLTGTEGEILATEYVAEEFARLGLEPAGDDGTWFQAFSFTAGVALGKDNSLRLLSKGEPLGTAPEIDRDWRPVAFSQAGDIEPAEVVFAGYGIVAPEADGEKGYDSYTHLDVDGRWVLVFRYMPDDITPERRQRLARYASLRYKAMVARDHGARGLLIVSGPRSDVREELVPLHFDASLSGTALAVVSIADDVAARLVAAAGKELEELQRDLDSGEPQMGFRIPGVSVAAHIELETVRHTGRNVLGLLRAKGEDSANAHPKPKVVVGAHVDHLGRGTSGSLAKDDEKGKIHYGADDNASGTATIIEIAEWLRDRQESGQLPFERDVLFAAWSGEELGLIGSKHFVESLAPGLEHSAPEPASKEAVENGARETESPEPETSGHDPHADPHAHGSDTPPSLHHQIAAYINLDMVGRLEKDLILSGVASSSTWRREIERRNAPIGLPISLSDDTYLPTDATSFYLAGVPILSAFTGSHSEYHTPRDTADTLDYDDMARIGRFIALVVRGLATSEEVPDYVRVEAPDRPGARAGLRAYLGTIPDYGESPTPGVALSGVAGGGPAEKAGVRSGDVIVELAGRKIENIYDYTFAIDALKIGEAVKIVVERAGERVDLEITPASRE